jgi:hypothetical protein
MQLTGHIILFSNFFSLIHSLLYCEYLMQKTISEKLKTLKYYYFNYLFLLIICIYHQQYTNINYINYILQLKALAASTMQK